VKGATWQVLRTATQTVRYSKLTHAFSGFAGGVLAFVALNSGPLLESQLLVWSMGIVSILLLAGMSSGITAQNHPSLARHLPDHPRALLSAMRWVSLPPLALALTAFAMSFPHGKPVGAAVLAIALLFNAISFLAARPWLAFFLFVAALGIAHSIDQLQHWLIGPLWLWTGMALVVTAWVLRFTIRNGNAAHCARQQRQQTAADLARLYVDDKRPGARHFGPGAMGTVMRIACWPVQRLVQSQSGRPVADETDAMRRALWLALPSQLPRTQFLLLAPVAVVCLLLAGLGILSEDTSSATQPLLTSLFGLMGVHLLSAWSLGAELWQGRREQALLVLLPRMPSAQRFNPMLRRQLLRNMLLAWLQTCAALLACTVLIDASFVPHMLAACTALLPVHACLANWRGQAARGPGQQYGPGVVLSLGLVSGLLFGLLTQPASWAVAVAGLALVCSAALWWNLKPRQAGCSWPVGRQAA
jgi:hypothetical protein